MADKLVLVTGGAGFIGSYVVERLCKSGYRVRIVDNCSGACGSSLLAGTPKGVEVILGDLADQDVAYAATDGVWSVVHLAAVPGVQRSWRYPVSTQRSGEMATLNLFQTCVGSDVRRVVVASSAAVYGRQDGSDIDERELLRPVNPYGASKAACEAYASAYGREKQPDVVCLRYFNVYGRRQPLGNLAESAVIPRFIDAMTHGRLVYVFGDGNQTRDFIHAEDVAYANLLALEREAAFQGMAINIGTGLPTSINDLVSRLASITKTKPTIRRTKELPVDIRHSTANITLARRELRFEPRVTLDDGLRDTVAGAS